MSNHITLTGNITRDPELKFTASGQGRTVLTIATNRRFFPKGAAEPTEVTAFFTVVAWSQLAEHVCESLRKGDRVTVSGRLDQRTWTDENGQPHSAFEVAADDVAASVRFRTVNIDRPQRDDSSPPASQLDNEGPLSEESEATSSTSPTMTAETDDVDLELDDLMSAA